MVREDGRGVMWWWSETECVALRRPEVVEVGQISVRSGLGGRSSHVINIPGRMRQVRSPRRGDRGVRNFWGANNGEELPLKFFDVVD